MRPLIRAALVIPFGIATSSHAAPTASFPAPIGSVTLIDESTDRQAIETVISSQIDAFKRDDAEAAWALAAPGIHAMFASPSVFLEMVRTAYQAVYRPRQFSFGRLAIDGDQATQSVDLIGPDGEGKTAIYKLARQADGRWLIDGCALVVSGKNEA